MRNGDVAVQGTGSRKRPVSLMLGFATDTFSYLVDVGLPTPSQSLFARDPEVKREVVWDGPVLRPSATLQPQVGTWSAALGGALSAEAPDAVQHELVKEVGETRVADQGLLTRPTWDRGSR
jgi:predicted ATPase